LAQKDCSSITGPGGEKYNLTPIVGTKLTTNDGFSDYSSTLCQDGLLNCGGCVAAGFCQDNEFFHDCLGTFASATVQGTGAGSTVVLLYDKGDWGNSAQVKIKCNPNVDGVSTPVGEDFYKTIVCESKYACPVGSNTPLDPGYPYPISFPGYYSVTGQIAKGAAIAIPQPFGVYNLTINITFVTTGTFQVYLLDANNFLSFMGGQPFTCKNPWTGKWGHYSSSEAVAADGSTLYVVVVPEKSAVLAVTIMAA